MELGKRLVSAREEANMTQQELAEKLFVSRELVSKWEQGLRRPDHSTIVAAAAALGVNEDRLIDRSEYLFSELQRCVPPGAAITAERLAELISRFLMSQPQKDADLFVSRYYLLESNAEIARDYGMGQNHVRSRLSKTAKRLAKFLKEECRNEGN